MHMFSYVIKYTVWEANINYFFFAHYLWFKRKGCCCLNYRVDDDPFFYLKDYYNKNPSNPLINYQEALEILQPLSSYNRFDCFVHN